MWKWILKILSFGLYKGNQELEVNSNEITIENKNPSINDKNKMGSFEGNRYFKYEGEVLEEVPITSGIYMFVIKGVIQYIGQTNNFQNRLSQHTFEGDEVWRDTIRKVNLGQWKYGNLQKNLEHQISLYSGWILFKESVSDLNMHETDLLNKYETPFNKSKNGTVVRNADFKEIVYFDGNVKNLKGIHIKPQSWDHVLRVAKQTDGKVRAGITGVTEIMNYKKRREFHKQLRSLGLSITKEREEKLKLWIIGDLKPAQSAIDAIDVDDYVIYLSDLILLLKATDLLEEWFVANNV